jgi:hypothetical protein
MICQHCQDYWPTELIYWMLIVKKRMPLLHGIWCWKNINRDLILTRWCISIALTRDPGRRSPLPWSAFQISIGCHRRRFFFFLSTQGISTWCVEIQVKNIKGCCFAFKAQFLNRGQIYVEKTNTITNNSGMRTNSTSLLENTIKYDQNWWKMALKW